MNIGMDIGITFLCRGPDESGPAILDGLDESSPYNFIDKSSNYNLVYRTLFHHILAQGINCFCKTRINSDRAVKFLKCLGEFFLV